MLAYSSIAHAGYALVGFTAANASGVSGILFYLLSYTFMNIGAFAIIILVGKKGEPNNNVQDYAGFGTKHPVLAMCMSIFLFSLAGIPPTAGFIGKFYLFAGAVQDGYIWLAIIGVLNSAASVYYYLRVMVYMYMKKPRGGIRLGQALSGGHALHHHRRSGGPDSRHHPQLGSEPRRHFAPVAVKAVRCSKALPLFREGLLSIQASRLLDRRHSRIVKEETYEIR